MVLKVLSYFINEPRQKNKGQVFEDSRRFRKGISILKSKTNIALPIPLLLIFEMILLFSISIDALTRQDIDLVDKFAEFCVVYNCLTFLSVIYFVQRDIDELSDSVDFWWTYRLLDTDRISLKEKCNKWTNIFNRFFYNMIFSSCIGYCLLPCAKFTFNGSNDFTDLYIFRMWTPLPQDKLWAVTFIYTFQMCAIFVQFFSFGTVTSYMMSVAMSCSYQIKLVQRSCSTVQSRVLSLLRKDFGVVHHKKLYSLYSTMIYEEIAESAKHYQCVYRNWKKMCKYFSRMADAVFYTSMVIVIMFGVRVATEKENKFIFMHAFIFIAVVIINQYLFTIINNIVTNEVDILGYVIYDSPWYTLPLSCRKIINIFQIMISRVPTLSTFMGVEASREFFAKTSNATYFYISGLVSMNNR